ncbi:MAG TPA: hypothetical protein VIL78_20260 [Hanamia sp.]
MFKQKLEYIHYNPVRAGCVVPEDYYYSSAKNYLDGKNSFEMLTHFSETKCGLNNPVGRETRRGRS